MTVSEQCPHHEWVEKTAEANVGAIIEIRRALDAGAATMAALKSDVGLVKKLTLFAVLAILGLFINGVADRVWPKDAAPAVAADVAHADADRAHADAMRAASLLQTVAPNAPHEK